MSFLLTTEIEIAASPAFVREKFLDFTQIKNYSPNGFIVSIASATNKSPVELVPGDVLIAFVGGPGGMRITPRLGENSPQAFIWTGSIPYIFIGEHAFRFEAIEGEPAKTRFVHEERFWGLLGWIMGDSWITRTFFGWREKTKAGFEGYNVDLKNWVEGRGVQT